MLYSSHNVIQSKYAFGQRRLPVLVENTDKIDLIIYLDVQIYSYYAIGLQYSSYNLRLYQVLNR